MVGRTKEIVWFVVVGFVVDAFGVCASLQDSKGGAAQCSLLQLRATDVKQSDAYYFFHLPGPLAFYDGIAFCIHFVNSADHAAGQCRLVITIEIADGNR